MTDELLTHSLTLHHIYLKDISFESPGVPGVFPDGALPDSNVDITTDGKNIEGDKYEVIITVTVTAKDNDGVTLYLVEIKQAGLFTLEGFDEERLKGMLGAYCPELLFPFAREALASLVAKGGFPLLLLPPVNFHEMYLKQVEGSSSENVSYHV